MNLPSPLRDEEQVLRVLVESMREGSGGAAVVHQHLVHALLQKGVDRPDELLGATSSRFIVYDPPLQLDSWTRPTPFGLWCVDSSAAEIHRGFVPALRGCYDFFCRQEPLSPVQAKPVVARADELLSQLGLSPATLLIVGHLLDVDKIGQVEWTGDPASPWTIGLDSRILRYGKVGSFPDYLQIWWDGQSSK